MKSYSDRDLNAILAHFSVADKAYTFAPLTDGFINDTFLVFDDEAPQYILQRVNHDVFKDISGVMHNIKQALNSLKATDYRKITLVETKAGKEFLELRGETLDYWRMMTYIDQSTAHNTTTDPKIAFEAGRIIGKFHTLLKNANHQDYVDTIPKFHDIDLRKKQFEEAFSKASGEKLATAESPIAFTKELLSVLKKKDFDELPTRVCHNDTKLNNILFSKETGKALCLIDLD
ncbi:MAG: aminoglycoside phosphotransferase family protein, partial [Pricia sp.]